MGLLLLSALGWRPGSPLSQRHWSGQLVTALSYLHAALSLEHALVRGAAAESWRGAKLALAVFAECGRGMGDVRSLFPRHPIAYLVKNLIVPRACALAIPGRIPEALGIRLRSPGIQIVRRRSNRSCPWRSAVTG